MSIESPAATTVPAECPADTVVPAQGGADWRERLTALLADYRARPRPVTSKDRWQAALDWQSNSSTQVWPHPPGRGRWAGWNCRWPTNSTTTG